MVITAIKFVGMTVSDMERSIDFYTTVLFFNKIFDREDAGIECDRFYGLSDVRVRIAKLQLGEEIIELTEFLNPKGRPIPTDSRSNDLWFQHIAIAVQNIEQVYAHLQHFLVSQTSPYPQTLPEWNPIAGGIQAFYFKDPDGHNLELIHFPEGKGNPKWQRSSSKLNDKLSGESIESLFLGIDHTAIVVSNTDMSRAFYVDRLGIKLEQEGLNLGIEQERLSGIAGAEVKISSLKGLKPSADSGFGMGIELLEYLKPNHGRSIPLDTCGNDLWCWQTAISIDIISDSEFDRYLLQDPDGHKLNLFWERK